MGGCGAAGTGVVKRGKRRMRNLCEVVEDNVASVEAIGGRTVVLTPGPGFNSTVVKADVVGVNVGLELAFFCCILVEAKCCLITAADGEVVLCEDEAKVGLGLGTSCVMGSSRKIF